MSNIQIFKNEQFGEIRTIEESGKVLFCGKDVATSLGYADTINAKKQHCRGVGKRHLVDNLGRKQETNFIPESDVYRLVFGSKLPNAERFTDWVTEEVLPTIRKTGGYVSNDDLFISTYLPHADEATKVLFQTTLATMRNLNNRIEADKPKVLFADSVSTAKTSILVGELAKILKQNGVDIGQNRMFDWLRNNGYLISRYGAGRNMPTQRSMEMGLFEIKETSINRSDGTVTISKTVKVTGKGQIYFVNRFLGRATA